MSQHSPVSDLCALLEREHRIRVCKRENGRWSSHWRHVYYKQFEAEPECDVCTVLAKYKFPKDKGQMS